MKAVMGRTHSFRPDMRNTVGATNDNQTVRDWSNKSIDYMMRMVVKHTTVMSLAI